MASAKSLALIVSAACLLLLPTAMCGQVSIGNGPNFGPFPIGEIQNELDASGGNGTYTWSLVSGSLPPGISLRTDLAPYFSRNASAGLIGVATAPGTYHFTLQVASGGQTATQAFVMTIAALQFRDAYQLPDAFVNNPYTYQLTPSNNQGTAIWSLQNGLPPGLTLSPSGLISGSPTQSGFYNVNVQLSDAVSTVARTIAIPVFDVQITTPGTLPNTTLGAAYAATIAASGGTPPYTFTSSGLPGSLVLDPESGNITGNIDFGPGVFGYFSLTATDSKGLSYSKVMSIDVVGVPPTLPTIGVGSPTALIDDAPLGTDYTSQLTINAGTAPYTWTATGLPPGLSIRYGSGVTSNYVSPGNAELWGRATQLGTFNVTITVTDGTGATATNSFPLHVSEIFQDFNDRFPNGTVGVPYSFKTRVIGGNGPYTLSSDQSNLPNGLTFNGSSFLLSGTANEAGGYNLHLHFADAGNAHHFDAENYFNFGYPANGTQTLTISNTGDLGTAQLGSYNFQLSACCASSYVWTSPQGSPPLPPGLTLSSNGLLTGVLTTPGTYNFVVQVADGNNAANVALRYFVLRVSPIQNLTQYPQPTGNVSSAYSFTFTTSGGTGSLTWTVCAGSYLPLGLTLSAGGTITGTPSTSGQYAGCVNVSDQAGNTTPIYFDISIYPMGTNPSLDLPLGPDLGTFSWGEIYRELHATGGMPPYHYSLTPGANVIPGVRVQDGQPLPLFFSSGTTAGLVGVITATGQYSTSIRVTDSLGNTFDRAIHFNVTDLQEYLGQNPPNSTVSAPYSFTLNAIGGSGNYSFRSNGGLPPGLSVNSSGIISGTPTTAGTYNANFILADLSNSQQYFFGLQMVVDPYAITTDGVLPGGTAGVAYNQQFTAPGCGSGCTWSIVNGGAPANLSLNPAGLLSGIPNFSGNFVFTVQASGSNGTVLKRFSWQVVTSPPQPLFISMQSDFGPIPFAVQWLFLLYAQGGTGPYSWSITSGSLPPGMSLYPAADALGGQTAWFANPGQAIIAGPARQLGQFSFTLQVTDANNQTRSQAFTIEVSPMRIEYQYNNLPIPGNPLAYNMPYSQPLLAVGGDGNYTWTAIDPLPTGLNFTSAGVVNGTPTETGNYGSQIRVTDGHSNYYQYGIGFDISSSTASTLTFNLAPNLGVYQQGSQPNIFLYPAGGIGPYTITALNPLPPGLVLLTNSNQPIAGAESSNFILTGSPMAAGTFSFAVQIQDTQGNIGARTFSITIAPFTLFSNLNLADGSVGVPYSVPLVAFDNSGSPMWALAPGSTLPPGLSFSAGGLISGTPTQAGQFSFQVTATDGGATITYTVNVHISGLSIQDAEVLPNALLGVSYNYAFAASGTPGVTWSATGLPAGLQLSSSGVITGTTLSGGRSNIFVTASTSTDHVQEHFVLYVITPNPGELTMPSANSDPNILGQNLPDAVMGQNYQYALLPAAGTPPYTFTVAAASSLPAGLALYGGAQLQSIQDTRVPGVTVLAGVPAIAGTYNFTLILTDGLGHQTSAQYSLNVSALNVLPNSIPSGIAETSYSEQFTVVGGTAPYTFSVTPTDPFTLMLPTGLTMLPSGLLSGTTPDTGNFSFVLHVQDANGNTFARFYSFSFSNQSNLKVTVGKIYDDWIGSGEGICLSTNGNSAYTWSVVSGAIPPGMFVESDSDDCGANGWILGGPPRAAGTYTFRLRATDKNNPANFADETLTLRVSPFQRVFPGYALLSNSEGLEPLPIATVGSPYSAKMKFAGGAAPYTVSNSGLYPLPAGITLGPDGTLSGTPQVSGSFVLIPVVGDANGNTINTPAMQLLVVPPGAQPPLVSPFYPDIADTVSVGSPYAFNLDSLFTWHRAPATQSWSLAPNSTLPPGLALAFGSNGLPTYLAGIPTTAGNYAFQLTATDGSGQSLTFNVSLTINVLALNPEYLPTGIVGTLYSAPALVPSGGVPPYTITLPPYSDMPPGLSFDSTTETVSGIPTNSGQFFLTFNISDMTGNSIQKSYEVVIDSSSNTSSSNTGDAPGLTVGPNPPNPIQVLYTLGSSSPISVPVNVSTTSGVYPFTLAESGLAGATLSANSGMTSTSVNLSIDASGYAPGTYVGIIGAAAPQTVNQYDTTPVILTVVPPTPCTYTLTPSGYSTGSAAITSTFGISTGANCSSTAMVTPGSSWISITSSGCAPIVGCSTYSSTGSTTMRFHLSQNTGATQRTGTITVNGQPFTITQFGTSAACSYAISPGSLLVSAAGGMATVNVTVSNSGCSWTASGLNAVLSSGTSTVTGQGSATLTIPANSTNVTQMLSAAIAGQTFNATQSGANCTVALGAPDASWPANGGAGSVSVTTPAGCSYSTVTGPSWITVTSGATGTGPGNLLYTVDPNSTTQSRTGALTIGGKSFQISEAGAPCSISVDTSGLGSPFSVAGGAGSIGITTNGASCSWSAQDADSFVTLVPSSGTGNRSIGVTVGSNGSSVSPRTSSININGQSVTLTQSGVSCSYALQSANGTVPAAGGTGTVGVITPSACGWNAISNNTSWLAISASGTAGNADVQFVAQANTSTSSRSGTLTIAGLAYTVSQAGAPCSYSLPVGNTTVDSGGISSGSFNFATANTGCTPLPVSYSNWLTMSGNSFSGNAGTVTFDVAPNPTGANRQGTIQVGDQGYTVTELGAQCAYSLNSYGATFDKNGGSSDLRGTPNALGCSLPIIGTDQPSFAPLTGTPFFVIGDIFEQDFSVTPFMAATPDLRFAQITVGGQIFYIKQTSW